MNDLVLQASRTPHKLRQGRSRSTATALVFEAYDWEAVIGGQAASQYDCDAALAKTLCPLLVVWTRASVLSFVLHVNLD